jgi:hypothetical protein
VPTKPADQITWMAWATLGNKGRSSEQGSVANDRQQLVEISSVAGKRNAQDSYSSQ